MSIPKFANHFKIKFEISTHRRRRPLLTSTTTTSLTNYPMAKTNDNDLWCERVSKYFMGRSVVVACLACGNFGGGYASRHKGQSLSKAHRSVEFTFWYFEGWAHTYNRISLWLTAGWNDEHPGRNSPSNQFTFRW